MLGFVIYTITMSFHIPERKAEKLKSLLGSAFGDTSPSYRELARIAGSMISVASAMGPISRLLTRQMCLVIESRSAWDHILRFSPVLLEELRFWYNNIDSFNGYSLRPLFDSSTVFSDANDVAFGGFSASLDGVMASGMFTSEDLGFWRIFKPNLACGFSLMWRVLRPELTIFRPDGAFVWPVMAPGL